MSRNAIGLYCLLALSVSWALQIFGMALFGLDSAPARLLFVGVMWSPTLLALAFIVLHAPARRGVLWKIGNPLYLPLGIAVETVIGFIVVCLLVSWGQATSGWFSFRPDGVAISGGPWLLGSGLQNWPLFVANVAATAIAYSVFGLVASTGEEFAWRGFLQGNLIRQFGVRRGILLLGLFWWAWHLPALLAGYNFPQTPLLGALVLFPIQLIGAAFFFGWLTLRARSFWPAALGHAAVNSIQEGVISNLRLTTPHLEADILRTSLIAAVGLISWLALTLGERSAVGEASGA